MSHHSQSASIKIHFTGHIINKLHKKHGRQQRIETANLQNFYDIPVQYFTDAVFPGRLADLIRGFF